MDVLRGLRGGDPYQEFRKGEGLQGLQASVRAAAAAAGGGGGGFRATAASVPDVASSLHGSPLVPSMSGGYSFQKSSDIQEVPSWSVSRPKSNSNRDHSSEDDAGFWPAASQQNGSFKPQKTAGGSSGGSSSTENYFTITSNFSHRNNHFENNTGQSPPELVRDTMLRQDAQFREQVQELHRVHKLQVYLMAEMQKREAVAMQHVQAATCDSVNANNNKNSRAGMMQAPLLKTEYQEGSGLGAAGLRCDQVTERGGYTGKGGEAATTVADVVEQGREFGGGGNRKPGRRRRIFDLERLPDENMDEEDDEEEKLSGEAAAGIKVDVEAEELRLRLSSGWAQQDGDRPVQDHLPVVTSRSDDNIVHEAPFRPTPTVATQGFLGGLWGLSLERKSNEAEGDYLPGADVSSHKKEKHSSLQFDIGDNPSHQPTTKMTLSPAPSTASLWEDSRTGTPLLKPQQQDSRNEGTWFQQQQQQQQQQPQQQQQQHIWVHSAEGVYQAPPAAIGMLPAPQTYAPFKLTTNETMPLFPAAREGESLPAGFTPPVYKQTYTLAAAAVPVQLHPYEGPIALPRQGLVVSAMNAAAWYSHTVPPVQQGGWQPVNAFHADTGAIYAFPAAAAPPLAFNVDLVSSGSWTTGDPGPPFSPFSVLQPPKAPFKKPPKLVLRQDGTKKEMKLLSPKTDHSPSVSSGEEVGMSSVKEQDDTSQGEGGNPSLRSHEGQVGSANRAFAGWVPKAGVKREREQMVSPDQDREGKSTSRTVARSPAQGPLKSYGDEGCCLSDGSGSGSGQSGVGNVINPGEYVAQPAPALGSDQILPAGNGEEGGTKLSELDIQQVQQQQQWQQHNAVDRWNQASSDECGDVSDVNEDGNHHHHHQGCEAPLKPPQHSSASADPAQNSAEESIVLSESTLKPPEACSLQFSKVGCRVEESTMPDDTTLSPKSSHKNSQAALQQQQGSCTTKEEDDTPDLLQMPASSPVPKAPPPEPAVQTPTTISPTPFPSFGNRHKPADAEFLSISSPKAIILKRPQQEAANGDISDAVHM